LSHRATSGLFHDIVDDPTTFEEATLAAMLAYAALTGTADGWLPAGYDAVGRSLLETVVRHIGPDGLLRPACGSPNFDRPGISVEAQAWFLLAVAAGGKD
jgi:unsaturated rhamnogalacturonyl hydrolase